MSDKVDLDDLPQPEYDGALPPEELDTDGDNPNEMTDEQFGLLCDRMRQNGWLGGPIITDTDGLIADGEHRWRAAKENDLTEVPVRQYDIDDATRRLWRQELNKIHGEHDRKRDALEYDYLLDSGFTEQVTALTEAAGEDLDELLAEIRIDGSRPAAYDYDPEHNVYFEDCVEGMRERLDDDSVDCVITDPPYGIDYDATHHEGIDDSNYSPVIHGDKIEDTVALWHDFLSEVARVAKPGGHVYCFTANNRIPQLQPAVESHLTWKNKLVWVKNNKTISLQSDDNYMWGYEEVFYAVNGKSGNPLNGWPNNVLEFDGQPSGEYSHPTQKPVSLITELMANSTQPGDTVLDPFMGSGTTAVAAIQNDRDYVGFEIDAENYREVIERRIGEAKRQREATVNADE